MSSQQSNPSAGKLAELQTRAKELLADARLADVTSAVEAVGADVAKLPGELTRLRSRGYKFASELNTKVPEISGLWNSAKQDIDRAMDEAMLQLRKQVNQVETLLSNAENPQKSLMGSLMALPQVEQALDTLESAVKAAESRIKTLFTALERDAQQAVEQLRQLHEHLDLRDEASFEFLAGENLYLTASGEWVATGKGGEDPDGTLFLTDQRLLFEQNEKTGKKLGLFGGKQTQELKWEIPLSQIENVEAENKGLLGGKDLLHFTLGAGATYGRITVEVKGAAKSKAWAEQIERMMRGEIRD